MSKYNRYSIFDLFRLYFHHPSPTELLYLEAIYLVHYTNSKFSDLINRRIKNFEI